MIIYDKFEVDLARFGIKFSMPGGAEVFQNFKQLTTMRGQGKITDAQWAELNEAARKAFNGSGIAEPVMSNPVMEAPDAPGIPVPNIGAYEHYIFGKLLRIDRVEQEAYFDHVTQGSVVISAASVMEMASALRQAGAVGPNWFKYPEPQPLTVDEAIGFLLQDIRLARSEETARKRASAILTKVTTAIGEVVKGLDDDAD